MVLIVCGLACKFGFGFNKVLIGPKKFLLSKFELEYKKYSMQNFKLIPKPLRKKASKKVTD
jgi:hypothetical protein